MGAVIELKNQKELERIIQLNLQHIPVPQNLSPQPLPIILPVMTCNLILLEEYSASCANLGKNRD
jgi:hypothetical protein